MHPFVAEALPIVPYAGAGGLAALGLVVLLGTMLATGMLKAWDETLGSFIRHLANWIDVSFSILGHRVHPFGTVARLLRAADHQVRNAFAFLALKGEEASAWCFSQAGHMFWWTTHELASLAEDTLHALTRVSVQTIPASIRRAEAATLARLHGIDRTIGRLEAQAKAQLKRLQVGIDRLGHRLEHVITAKVAALTARVGTLTRAEKATTKRISRVEARFKALAFAGLVALALTRIFGSWIRCPSIPRIGRRIGCKGFAGIEALLALTFDAIIVSDLCLLATAMTKGANLFADEIGFLSSQIAGLAKCQNATRPRGLSAAYYAPPPVANSLEL